MKNLIALNPEYTSAAVVYIGALATMLKIAQQNKLCINVLPFVEVKPATIPTHLLVKGK